MEHEPLTAAKAARQVRAAVPGDQQKIADLIFLESHVHRHLDWRAPVDWLGHTPYWVIEEGRRLAGALACPPDPESIAWIRLFVYATHLSGQEAWRLMWEGARQELRERGHVTAAAIAVQRWLDPILLGAGFELAGQIILLERDDQPRPRIHNPASIHLRPMQPADLEAVVDVDAAAFDPLWRNSLPALAKAFQVASYASIAEDASGLIGYQLSTGSEFGTHLARLAVRPQIQRRGVGAALIGDLLSHVPEAMAARVTVNTQADNAASLALYHRLGFRRTGERYPVYRLEVD